MRSGAWAARLLPRLARLLISRNALRRRSDRIEGAGMAVLAAVFAAALVAAFLAGARIYRGQRSGAEPLYPAIAVMSASGPGASGLTGSGAVRARWRAPDGQLRYGTLTTLTAPAISGATAGTRVPILETRSGVPAVPPLSRLLLLCVAVLVAFSTAATAGLLLIICYRLFRHALDRRRLAQWESAWAATGPRWTTRR